MRKQRPTLKEIYAQTRALKRIRKEMEENL